MKIFASLLGAFFVAALGASSSHGGHVDDVIIAQMRERHIPAVALAMIQESRVIREQSYGLADKEKKMPVTSSTLFQAASVSKPVAALGALHLVEQGELWLDENVNAKLRSWKIPENRFTKNHPVTLRLILSHSAGLTVHGFSGYPVGAPIPSLVQILDGKPPANSAPIRVDQIPGSRWSYSGGGFVVMQRMMMM
jgi:CubicO group peptidase (beta-lactamase class C family)